MKYPYIIAFDDDKAIPIQFSKILSEDGFEVIKANSSDELISFLENREIIEKTCALIFDLAQSQSEMDTGKNFKITEKIKENFDKWRIPIFIHSGFASTYTVFNDCGTVWKKEKTGTSVEEVCAIINKLHSAGFSETFGPGGDIETNLLFDLHRTFTEQFREGEIDKIIDSVPNSDTPEYKMRLGKIFKRIAVKSLMSDLLSPIVSNGEMVNPIEHYYRRISKIDFWTGDIFKKNNETELILILTPRCDVAINKTDSLLVCNIEPANYQLPNKKEEKLKKLRSFLTDNIEGKATRYLPSSPVFIGGKVNLALNRTLKKEEIKENYTRIITLSDDLTNEILGKFAYYFMRTGISAIDPEEFNSYLEILNESENAAK